MNLWLIILGARVHMSAYINTARISEPDLVSIGSGTILDAQSVISPHTTEMGGLIRIAPINLPAGSYVACSGAVYGPCDDAAAIHVNALSVHSRETNAAMPKCANAFPQSCPSATSVTSSSSLSSPSSSIQSDASAALCLVSYRPCPFRLTISAITALFSVLLIGAISVAASYPAYRVAALLARRLDLVEYDLANVDMGYVLLGLCFTLPWPGLPPLILLFAQFNGVQLLAPGWLGPLPVFVCTFDRAIVCALLNCHSRFPSWKS